MQVELIRFRKNIDFIDVGNFEVGIYFRDRRVYETGLIAIRDVSPLFCAGSSHEKSVQAPIWLKCITLHSISDCLGRLEWTNQLVQIKYDSMFSQLQVFAVTGDHWCYIVMYGPHWFTMPKPGRFQLFCQNKLQRINWTGHRKNNRWSVSFSCYKPKLISGIAEQKDLVRPWCKYGMPPPATISIFELKPNCLVL